MKDRLDVGALAGGDAKVTGSMRAIEWGEGPLVLPSSAASRLSRLLDGIKAIMIERSTKNGSNRTGCC